MTASGDEPDPARFADVVIVGDGPAGSALASACRARGSDVLIVGTDRAWTPTYATWIDDLDHVAGIDDDVFATSFESIAVHTDRSRELMRGYATFDNQRLRARLRDGVAHESGQVVAVSTLPSGNKRLALAAGDSVDARVVVDAAGWPSALAPTGAHADPAWQTALGVVLEQPPAGDLGVPTWMDFRPIGGRGRSTIGPAGVTTFCYSLPVHDGWLVEETVLTARPAVEPIALLPRLAARLGRHPDDVLAGAVRTEYVRIPMGGVRPAAAADAVTFGAAAGYVHPATGFSVTTSLRAAPRVAEAIGAALDSTPSGPVATASIAEAIWPSPLCRTRRLHDYGLDTLLDVDDDQVREFFGVFFDLPVADWSAYLRVDTPPAEVVRVMARLFRSSSWSLRRRLMSGNPAQLARLARR